MVIWLESISTSWGSWEWENNLANAPVTDPLSGKTFSFLRAAHELFVKAAVQGQSMFAAAGDQGAYDVFGELDNNGVPIVPPNYTVPLSVDYPASDPAITAGGGTTLAGAQTYTTSVGSVVIDIPEERVWGWDYLVPLCNALGLSPIDCGIYPTGGGGGVSVFFLSRGTSKRLQAYGAASPKRCWSMKPLFRRKSSFPCRLILQGATCRMSR